MCDHFREGEISVKTGGNRQSLSKQAESALQFLVLASSKRCPHYEIVLSAQAPEQGLPGGKKHIWEGGGAFLRESFHLLKNREICCGGDRLGRKCLAGKLDFAGNSRSSRFGHQLFLPEILARDGGLILRLE